MLGMLPKWRLICLAEVFLAIRVILLDKFL